LVLCAQPYASERHASKIAPNGETTVSAAFGKTKLVAVFHTSTVEISTDDKTPRFAQCTYSRVPCSLTGQIKIFVDGTDILVPGAAYADLGDISTAEFSTKEGFFVLTITGGDASESYLARLVFNKNRLLERRLYSGEDPDHVLEVSHFYKTPALN
jgi:hypothetical protein